ncbi:DUF3808 domain-containing protein [Verrucomicrobiaceae bacterium N1E253]|uniref:DUF3808 domain-containing protein n=1 Tax=Oceaniferula marina TaxID=2748318 RepID=A0A851GH35_9BACT|nr:tetratricopeptide repeat protein [Oceaniferula marina]NWK54437.1 DUF3808 domain-containing protein [Oceaniferula marina]
MILRLTILFASLCLTIQAAPEKTAPPAPPLPDKAKALQELTKSSHYQHGLKAMEDQLPDLAIRQFRTILSDPKLGPDAKAYVQFALAKALIQTGLSQHGSDQHALEALELLNTPTLKLLPSAPLWKAEALAAIGKYQAAEEALAQIPSKHPKHATITLVRARILIALAQNDGALKLLKSLTESNVSETRNLAHLLTAEIQINKSAFDDARKQLDQIKSTQASTERLKDYLVARLALAEGKSVDAISRFRSLVTETDHLSQRIYHACVLGLSDALAAHNQIEDSIGVLENHISQHPNSSILLQGFLRLGQRLSPNLPANHPSMQKLIEWSAPPIKSPDVLYITGDTSDALPMFQPPVSEHDDLVTLALYLRASLLAKSNDPKQHAQALALLNRLRTLHPAHSLPPSELYLQIYSKSLLETAQLQLKQKRTQQATYTLEALEKVAFSPAMKDQANSLLGILQIDQSQYKEALAAFNMARESTSEQIAEAASINAGISALLASDMTAFNKILDGKQTAHIETSLTLERALWKCRNNNASGRMDLDRFIATHPGHPRENEARLALAAAGVDISPPDILLTNAQLEIITPKLPDEASQYAITRIKIRAEELSQNWSSAAALAEGFIQQFPQSPNLPAVMLKQGEAYYHNEDFNKSRRVFQQVNDQFPSSPFAPYARFYTAMAARLGGTTQSREESISLFQNIIDSKHELADEARIQQSRVLIDLRRYAEAQKALEPILSDKQAVLSVRRDAGVLLADCFHRQAANTPEKYEQAVAIYDQLLDSDGLSLAWNNRLHFLKGQTLESMDRRTDALDTYYNVVIKGQNPPSTVGYDVEWFWFYRCGFKALSMLEADKRWEAAVKLAKRIASFDGPRAEEAYKRSHNLATTHMIWLEDNKAIPVDE